MKNALLFRGVASVFICVAGAASLGCSSGGAEDPPADGSSSPLSGCEKGKIESDFFEALEPSGPGVDPQTKQVRAGSYVIASTYLALKPELDHGAAMEVSGPVIEAVMTAKGTVAMMAGRSTACSTLRTLSVWESEEDMLAFVMGPAHVEAMSHTSELSRGTSNTISWEGNEEDVAWEEAARQLASENASDY
ncbi:hypothetical protein [Sorangium sp. So ce131]|uniref:hypothetical protein n=1 Tax=Sorangium sp. So ce131 TaxID=3133282 RepID=UPI003F61410E